MSYGKVALFAYLLAATACGGESSSDGTGGTGGGGTSGGGGTGGTSGGGAGGTSGTGGSSGGWVGSVGECTADSDCELLNSCCYCLATPKGQVSPPYCEPTPCFADRCSVEGVTTARCIAGQCTKARNCDGSQVSCEMVKPSCPEGQVPSVQDTCWGECVPVTDCAKVDTCFDCTGPSVCVGLDAFESSYHCVNPPVSCTSGCACLGAKACVTPFTSCTDSIKDGSAVHCSCPSC